MIIFLYKAFGQISKNSDFKLNIISSISLKYNSRFKFFNLVNFDLYLLLLFKKSSTWQIFPIPIVMEMIFLFVGSCEKYYDPNQ